MLGVRHNHRPALVLHDLHRVVRITDCAVIKRKLDAIVGQFLADLKCLTEFRKLRLPSIDGASGNSQLLSDFEVRRSVYAKICGLLTEFRLILGRSASVAPRRFGLSCVVFALVVHRLDSNKTAHECAGPGNA